MLKKKKDYIKTSIAMLMLALALTIAPVKGEDVMPIKQIQPPSYKVSKQSLLWMYTMKTRFWSDGTRITVFYQDPTSTVHKLFCQKVLEIQPTKFDQMISTYVNSGNASYFRQAKNSQEVYKKVSLYPGSIGYINETTLLINDGSYVSEIIINEK